MSEETVHHKHQGRRLSSASAASSSQHAAYYHPNADARPISPCAAAAKGPRSILKKSSSEGDMDESGCIGGGGQSSRTTPRVLTKSHSDPEFQVNGSRSPKHIHMDMSAFVKKLPPNPVSRIMHADGAGLMNLDVYNASTPHGQRPKSKSVSQSGMSGTASGKSEGTHSKEGGHILHGAASKKATVAGGADRCVCLPDCLPDCLFDCLPDCLPGLGEPACHFSVASQHG